jgi:dihydrofolate synthase/folylpolyglutamate synthase
MRFGLERVERALSALGHPERVAPVLHVAGTNGKGSTCAMAAAALRAAGLRTGLYTSPHLEAFNERIQVDGLPIADEALAAAVAAVRAACPWHEAGAPQERLTYFEFATLAGLLHFARRRVEVAVIEVGLGGRLDATNVVQPEVCAITSISLEHTDVLGNTLAEIASEKAGIIKKGIPVVSAPQKEEVSQVIEKVSRERGALLIRAGQDIQWEGLGYDAVHQSLRVKGRLASYDLTIPLVGDYQLENATVAVGCLEVLIDKGFHLSSETIVRGMSAVIWPGRLQVLRQSPYVVVDGAHNPYSASKLRQALKKYFVYRRATLIIGTSSDKDISGIVSELAPVFNRVIVTRSIHPRAMSVEALVEQFARLGVRAEATDDISVALPMAISGSGKDDLVCVTGSLFVVAGAIELCGAPGLRPHA